MKFTKQKHILNCITTICPKITGVMKIIYALCIPTDLIALIPSSSVIHCSTISFAQSHALPPNCFKSLSHVSMNYLGTRQKKKHMSSLVASIIEKHHFLVHATLTLLTDLIQSLFRVHVLLFQRFDVFARSSSPLHLWATLRSRSRGQFLCGPLHPSLTFSHRFSKVRAHLINLVIIQILLINLTQRRIRMSGTYGVRDEDPPSPLPISSPPRPSRNRRGA